MTLVNLKYEVIPKTSNSTKGLLKLYLAFFMKYSLNQDICIGFK